MKLFTLGISGTCSNNRGYSGAVLTPTALKTSWRSKIGSLLVFFIFGLAMFMPSNMNAQTVVDIFNLPPARDCRSNDLHAVSATLAFPLCGPICTEEGQVTYYPITLAIDNTTKSERTNFTFFARLEQYFPDGTLANTYFVTGCNGPIAPDGITEVTYSASLVVLDENGEPTNFPGIPYLCGGSLKLINVYQAWTSAADNKTCPLNPSLIAPKCDVIEVLPINTPIKAVVENTTNISCFGDSNGAIDITVNGGIVPYTFVWSKTGGGFSASTEDVSGLAAGTYSVTAKDANNCPSTITGIIITQPAAALSSTETHVNVLCNGGATGSINLSPSGGSAPYAFTWTKVGDGAFSASTEDLSNLTAGTYDVVITDANGTTGGCRATKSVVITQPAAALSSIETHVNVLCFGGATGSIDLTPSGGTEPYAYAWTASLGGVIPAGQSDDQDLSGLVAGTYEVVITDANGTTGGCRATKSVVITESPLLDPPTLQMPPLVCFSDPGNFIITSSTEGLLFQIDDGSFIAYPKGGFVGVSVGKHTITAKNAAGCLSDPLEFEIFPPFNVPVMPVLDATQPTCALLTGTIFVTNHVAGQTYYVRLVSDVPNPVFVTYPELGFSGLAPGAYVVLARSADLCSSDAALITLIEPICDDFEGCTLGYWKNHTDRWPSSVTDGSVDELCLTYTTCTLYNSVFTASTLNPNLTLLQALNLKGNKAGENLARQSVAALLNICSGSVNYDSEFASIQALKDYVNAAFRGGDVNLAGSHLDLLNNAGCPLGGSRANTSSNCTNLKVSTSDAASSRSFRASPVPFRETLSIEYDFDYSSAAKIQLFDLQGRLLRTYNEANAYKGKVTELSIDFRTRASQVYVIKITTDRDVFTKKIISDK